MGDSFDRSRGSGQNLTAPSPSIVSTVVQTAILGSTVIANLVGNICVCLAIWRVRTLRQKPGSPILASLAMSDFCWLSFLLFRLIWLHDFEAVFKVCEHFAIILGTLLHVDIAHICLLSCDRYIAIIYPLRYTDIVTRARVRSALLVAWVAPVVSTAVLPLFYVDSHCTQFRRSFLGCSESTRKPALLHKVHLVFNITLFNTIPFAVMIFVYGHIAKVSWFQSNRVEPGENLNPETADRRRRKRKEMKWMKTIGDKRLMV